MLCFRPSGRARRVGAPLVGEERAGRLIEGKGGAGQLPGGIGLPTSVRVPIGKAARTGLGVVEPGPLAPSSMAMAVGTAAVIAGGRTFGAALPALVPAVGGEARGGIVASALAPFGIRPAAPAAAMGATVKLMAVFATAPGGRPVMATMVAVSFRKTAQMRLRIYFDAI